MRGIKFSFEEKGLRLVPDEEVSGFEANAQNALVHILTPRGSDKIYPKRGTNILKEGVRGVVLSKMSMTHVVSRGASSALYFCREYEPETNGDSLQKVQLSVEEFQPGFASLSAYFRSISGLELGTQPLTLVSQ